MPIPINETLAIHILAVYKAMQEDSVEQENHRVYVGKLSQLVSGLGISSTYYSKIFRALYDGSYAVLEDRGARGKPSTVILLREPTKDELLGLTTSNPGPIISLVKQVEAINASLGGMYVAGTLKEFERRLTDLEETIKGRK